MSDSSEVTDKPSLYDIYEASSTVQRVEERLRRLELLHRIGIALSAERNHERLLETILVEAQKLCRADGGTLYLKNDRDELVFAILRTDSLGVALGGTTGKPIDFAPISLRDPLTGRPNHSNVASFAACSRQSVNIIDAYAAEGFDFSGTKAFDKQNGYRSQSFLTIPLTNSEGRVLGVLQLINARGPDSERTGPFLLEDQLIVEALASQAGIAIDNQQLLQAQKVLLESFIRMIAAAIDAKSPYTGGHCERVPVLTELFAHSICETTEGPFKDFKLDEEGWYELRIAAWLHDCGKVTTPVHIMDKATKLEAIYDRIHTVSARFEVLKRDAELRMLRGLLSAPDRRTELEAACASEIAELDDHLVFLRSANLGGEYLSEDQKRRITRIANLSYRCQGTETPLLTEDEVQNLCVSRGTLTDEQRLIINGHMVQTIRMLESLPFPQNLRRVPEYAGGHHEKMDGTGYPKGLYAGDMSIPARIMAIADVFEALTASDRPYKPAKKLSEAMRIMGYMKRDNHLDPELFDHFVRSGVYKRYAERFLSAELIDEVDEAALLAIEPRDFVLPAKELRNQRFQDFLPQYRNAPTSVPPKG